jgi:hypothetical protein
LFDSFEGMPAPTAEDLPGEGIAPGDYTASPDDVWAAMHAVGADLTLIHITKGWFEQTLSAAAATIGPIALLSLDSDLYQSVRLTLEVLYPQVVPGGFVTVDDYGYWPGCKRAVDEYFAEHPVQLQVSDHSGVWFQKPSSHISRQRP